MHVSKWGSSLAIRLLASVVQALQLHQGDAAFIARLRKFRGKLPADFKFDRDEANGRD